MENEVAVLTGEEGEYICRSRHNGTVYARCYSSGAVALRDAIDVLGPYVNVILVGESPQFHTHDRKGDCVRILMPTKSPRSRPMTDAAVRSMNYGPGTMFRD